MNKYIIVSGLMTCVFASITHQINNSKIWRCESGSNGDRYNKI